MNDHLFVLENSVLKVSVISRQIFIAFSVLSISLVSA